MSLAARDDAIRRALTLSEGDLSLSVADFVSTLPARAGVRHVVGVMGAGAALLAQEISRREKQVLVVCASATDVAKYRSDLAYLQSRDNSDSEAKVVSLVGAEEDPYAQVQPERGTTLSRLAALSSLSRNESSIAITNAVGLVRKVPPRNVVKDATLRIEVDTELDVESTATRLANAGYLRVPMVEDPGSFAIRGGVFDIWSAAADSPARFELFGDLVLSGKTFEPDSQRSKTELRVGLFPPAREAILNEDIQRRATTAIRALCDQHNYPSIKTRRLIEDICGGRTTFGISGFLPAFYPLSSIWEYLSADVVVLVIQPSECLKQLHEYTDKLDAAEQLQSSLPHYAAGELSLTLDELEQCLSQRPVVSAARSAVIGSVSTTILEQLETPSAAPPSLALSDHQDLKAAVKAARSSRGKHAVLDPLLERIAAWCEHQLDVTIVARSQTQATRLASLLRHRGVEVRADSPALPPEADAAEVASPDARLPSPTDSSLQVSLDTGSLSNGVIAPIEGRVLVTEEEVFGQRAHRALRSGQKKGRDLLQDLRALAPGDTVVHAEHGVGRYRGLENRTGPGGIQLELVVVEYIGGKLFLPVYRLNQLQKFSGGDSPKLDRLGGQSFAKTKARARKKAREMADELLRLYAERHSVQKTPFPKPSDDYAAFEAAFPYEETRDQAAAIIDVSNDLESTQVMDRLVCGDVGFGKTEVALRAAFRVAAAGSQVAILCPTTVLAQQHFLTFRKRLEDTAFEVRVLSRFQSKKEVTATLEGIKKGTVDIVIGTHRLLSRDLVFKKLGLLVVDEEQRFGVTHKERIKQLRTSVDVLTLTATPIPRTLQQAVGGLREMSIIATPPASRRSIRTIVSQFDETVIKEAIERELSRGGQVFYVHNRVEGLYQRAERLQRLLPDLRIVVGHGQMKESALEQTMIDFIEGRYDVLAATSIVESGLDIPRANTMIIDRADLFGLAQLYQLRGRVGRSVERAYCYLLVPPPSELTDEARSRIEALERYTELGSGFHIATLDMELRGAGDLLGAEQSGTVASVGLELFCRMLEEATAELRGDEVVHDIEPELNFNVEALLPEDYISEIGLRLSLYKRLASAISEMDVMQLGTEMEDRFGAPPIEAQAFIELMRLKTHIRRLRITVCEGSRNGVSVRFREDTPLDAVRLAQAVSREKTKYRLSPDGRLTRRAVDHEQALSSIALAGRLIEELLTLSSTSE